VQPGPWLACREMPEYLRMLAFIRGVLSMTRTWECPMTIANFEEMCAGVCEIAGLQVPQLKPDADGTLSATVQIYGVEVALFQLASGGPGTMFIVAELGLPPDPHQSADWLALVDANERMPGIWGPAFSRNPQSGEALLQWSLPLDAIAVVDVFQALLESVQLALQWRRGDGLGASEAAILASAAFHQGRSFVPCRPARWQLLRAHFDPLTATPNQLADLLDSNFRQLASNSGARAGRDNAGDLSVTPRMPRDSLEASP
jgi:hypothetical protein